MTTALITHPDGLRHITPVGHPERVERLETILTTLEDFDLTRIEAPMADEHHVLLAHPKSYYDRISSHGEGLLDADTHMSAGTFSAAMRGVGANIKAVDLVMSGAVQNAFCAMRPPGHHAEKETPMGFCLFGNVAIAAKYALSKGASRVAIMDFDVHHGNGTQDLVWNDANIFFASTHQMPLYPGTGASHETGAHGNILNAPLRPNSAGATFRAAMESQVIPFIDAAKPELIFISAGFDAHQRDPLANLNWQDEDFAWATAELCKLAAKHCDGKVVSTLEGGYDLEGLATSVAAHVKTLMEYGK